MQQTIVVVGGGQAGMQIIDSLRRNGYTDNLYLICKEAVYPYQRPPLSKGFLAGKTEESRLTLRPPAFYEKSQVTVITGTAVELIDRKKGLVTLDNGQEIKYDQLALSTGACVRKLPVAGADLPGVYYLRTLEDAKRIRTQFDKVKNVAVIGGGFIGLEVAAIMRGAGKQVTIIEAQDRLLSRVVTPLLSDFYHKVHADAGCNIYCQTQVHEICAQGNNTYQVISKNGEKFSADIVIVGIGVIPDVELAERSGLTCDDGIMVDEYARTSDQSIVAAGDCTKHYNAIYDMGIRLESVQNAIDQAKTAALSLLGKDEKYAKVPWFWSDQYQLKLQIAGLSHSYTDTVIRGQVSEQGFSVFYFKNDQIIAVDSVNKPAEHMFMRKIMEAKIPITKAQATDINFNIKTLIQH